jgi:hypothetical protein
MAPQSFRIIFKDHLSEESVDGLINQIAALGELRVLDARTLEVVVSRAGKLKWLQDCLRQWEVHGFTTWKRI